MSVSPSRSTSGTNEFNVCGVLVQSLPHSQPHVEASLAGLPGVEVHEKAPDGRLVVTIEDTPDIWASETLAEVHKIRGVIAASLVYHHREDEPSSED